MTVVDDTVKGTTMGDPDGPMRFVDSLGCEVPTYVDPRKDLIAPNARGKFTYLDYHVPYQMRDKFRIEQWPMEYRNAANEGLKFDGGVKINDQGFVMCHGINKGSRSGSRSSVAGSECKRFAVHRTLFCGAHGSALHPADKKLSAETIVNAPVERVEKLDRVAQFLQGFVKIEDLSEEEIAGGFVRTTDGREIKAKALGRKIEQELSKELSRRLNSYLTSKTPRMLEVMYQIADNEIFEPADRIKAATWIAERTMGKTPDVVITSVSEEKPYESILDSIQSGSREDYRKKVAASRVEAIADVVGEETYAEEVPLGSYDENDVSGLDGGTGFEESLVGQQSRSQVLGSNGLSEKYGNSGSDGVYSDLRELPRNELESGDGAGTSDDVEGLVEKRAERKVDLKAARERIRKAKQQRFAARATGAESLENRPFLLEWKVIASVNSPDFGCYKMKLHSPDKITEALLTKVERSNDPAHAHGVLADAVAKAGL